MYIRRKAENLLRELSRGFPVVSVTGPRQSGKTTLAKKVFSNKSYVSLEVLDQLEYAKKDPIDFLNQSNKGLIIDEAQRCPSLFSYIQTIVDESPEKMGQFILTGSQQFGLFSKITQSLAGRVGCLELLPFSILELKEDLSDLDNQIFRGFYPPLYSRKVRPFIWYKEYIKTYIERDVRYLINIKELSQFQKFLGLCAARNGQLVNFSELSGAAGVDVRTVKNWISVLEASYILFLLKPFYKNFSKKLIKTPKIYFYDTGLLCSLLRIKKEDLALSFYKGSIFESMILSELIKHNFNQYLGIDFYFWRDKKGLEIDLLFEKAQKIYSIEIKSGKTVQPAFFKNLIGFKKYVKDKHAKSTLVYGGDKTQLRTHVKVLPWSKSYQVLKN